MADRRRAVCTELRSLAVPLPSLRTGTELWYFAGSFSDSDIYQSSVPPAHCCVPCQGLRKGTGTHRPLPQTCPQRSATTRRTDGTTTVRRPMGEPPPMPARHLMPHESQALGDPDTR
ncbi:hypothetical protein AAFF_G00038130 [Aldrovandia affinis]|uniref:Uncharacterized protein n=1 Tax=Aldrovandia affinis TaxID=143900 RepID=A0AAD7WYP9_9TELE|nr:hypothetical protein AAFF_G00038130 [Aldrovandia affinis]